MNLRAYILAMMAAALMPALLVQLHFAHEATRSIHETVRAEAVRLTTLVLSDLQSAIEGTRQFLSAIASIEAVADADEERCPIVLQRLAQENPRYTTISVSDLTGRIICSSQPYALGADVSNRPHFQGAITRGGLAAGNHVFGRVTGLPTLHLSMPFGHDHDQHAGVLTVGLNLRWLEERMSAVQLPLSTSVLLSDRNRIVLVRLPPGIVERGSPIPAPLQRAIEAGNYGLREQVDRDGIRRFFVTLPLGGAELGLHVSVGANTRLLTQS
jgi:hypothetical protein